MTMTTEISFVLVDPDYNQRWYPRQTYDLHCPGCGRYCKLVKIRPHYNGTFDLLTQITNCSKCGRIDIELV